MNYKSLPIYIQNKFVTLKYKTIIKKYHSKLHLEVVRGHWKPMARFSLRVLLV